MTSTRLPPDSFAERFGRWCASQLELSRPLASRPEGGGVAVLRTLGKVLVTLVVVVGVITVVAGSLGDAFWFSSVGFGGIWTTTFGYSVGLFVGTTLVSAIVLSASILAASRVVGDSADESTPGHAAEPDAAGARAQGSSRGPVRRLLRAFLFVIGLPIAGLAVLVSLTARFLAGTRVTNLLSSTVTNVVSGDATTASYAAIPRTAAAGSRAVDVSPTVDPGLRAVPARTVTWTLIGIGLLLATYVGIGLPGSWQTVALWLNQVPFPASGAVTADPIFGLDLGWWLFDLPFLHLVANTLALLLALTFLITAAAYGVAVMRGSDIRRRGPLLHLAVLGGAWLLAIAATQWLGRYDLSLTSNGVATGIGATDNALRLPFGALMAVTSIVLAVAFVIVAATRNARAGRIVALVGAGWYVLLVVAATALPYAYQQLVVTPSQNVAEAPYIANNIALTRLGYGLDSWQLQPYTGKATLTSADVSSDQATFNNARLWDSTALAATLDQLQTVRQYYDFTSVDIDRYVINGTPTEVLLSAREMALAKSQSNPTWVAQRVLYTHGYGLAMVPVNGVDQNGLPELLVKDLPTASVSGAPVVTQPRIYFGRRPSDWVLVDARSAEFDYPSNAANANDVTTRYSGGAGIPLGSPLARLFWAVRLADPNLLLSDQVTGETKLLLHRSLADRLGTLAPFLSFDPDPYLVIAPDGHLVYVQDAYTTSRALPDATATNDSNLGSTYDYIRNSVKITVDTYDGTTHFYVTDASDPIIAAWQKVFPGMFEPASAIPAGLLPHLRTPAAMFNTQVQLFARYHVTDVASFYKSDDLWTAAAIKTTKSIKRIQSYYVEMRLPDQTSPEFVLIEPMVPASRPNMIAWVAARNDGAARGEVVVYQLPASTTIQGPTQIEARIDQDPVISAQLSLWNQSGSKVIRGSLLTLPVGTSFLYVEPIYLQSTRSAFPQLAKVVVASSATVAWGNTLDQALADVTSGIGTGGTVTAGGGTGGQTGGPSPSPGGSPGASPGTSPLPTDVPGLIQYANQAFAAAKAAQAAGDFVTYGAQMQHLEEALQALDALRGGGVASSSAPPSPSGSASPTP